MSSPITGPRRRACCPPASAARSTATACSSWSVASSRARSRPTRPPSSPTPSPRSGSRPRRRWRPGRCSSSGSTGGPFGIRPVLPIAATQPPGRGDEARLVPRRGDAGRARPARARRRRRGARRGARPLGALALPERAVPLRAAARRARRPARRDVGAACGRAARRRQRGAAGDPRCASLRWPRASRHPARAEDTVRRSLVETLRHGDRATLVRSLDDALLGLRAAAGA